MQKWKKCQGVVNLALCCGATGEKLKPLVIRKSLAPHCFKGIDMKSLGIHWMANKEAWMTGAIFQELLQKGIRASEQKILHLLDNPPCLLCPVSYSNIKLLFLPPNAATVLQPLDQGIIMSFKQQYQHLMMHHLLAKIDYVDSASLLAKSLTVLDRVRWIPGMEGNILFHNHKVFHQ